MQDFQFIGSYDRRTRTGTIAAQDAHALVKASQPRRKPKNPKKNPKREWIDCQALAKVLGVLIGYDHIEFPNEGKFVTTFEKGKSYSYKYNSPNQCYESLLALQRDRLSRLSDAEAIASAEQAKSFFN